MHLRARLTEQVTSSAEIAALTSLRGVAAFAVLIFHFRDQFGPTINPDHLTLFFARGFLFVDFFFVLSGFVIALSYGPMFADAITPRDYAAFLIKRLARIYPLHIVILMGFVASECAKYLVATNANPAFSVNTGAALLANIFLVQSWGLFNHYTWNHPAWSISTEWFAYLLFPLLAFSLLRLRGFLRPLVVVLACGIVLKIFYAIPTEMQPGYFLLRCVPSFVLGMLVCELRNKLPSRLGDIFARDVTLLIALAAAFLAIAWPCPDIIVIAIFCLVVLAASLNCSTVARYLSAPPLYFLGVISYSIYLVHTLILRVWQMLFQVVWHSRLGGTEAITAFVIMTGLVLAVSSLSFYYVEAPGRNFFGRYAAKLSRSKIEKTSSAVGPETTKI